MAYAYNPGLQHNMPYHGSPYGDPNMAPAPSRTLWMGELDPWMNDDWLRQLFWSLGEEVTTRISIDKYGGTYAFIDFKTHEGATKILQTYNGTIIPNTNKYFKLNWSNRDGNGMPILNPSMHHNQNDGCSVFVGDLGPDVDDSILLAAFQSRYATTVSAKVMIDPTTGFSRGFGFVKFYDPADQQRSIDEMQGVYVGSRAVRVSIARPRSAFQNNNPNNMSLNPNVPEHEITTVFVGGLNNTITEEELRGYFGTYGDILAVKLIPNKNIAFIQYDKRSSAEQSIAELNGSHLGGAKLRLSFGRTQLNLGPTYHHNTPTYNSYSGAAAGGVVPHQPHVYQPTPVQHMLQPPVMPPPPIVPPPDLVDPAKPLSVDAQNEQFIAAQEEHCSNWNLASSASHTALTFTE